MRRWCWLLAGMMSLSVASAETPPPLPVTLPQAIEKSLHFVTDNGLDWMDSNSCTSCHHIPMMVWTLNHAQRHGYKVDEKLIAEGIAWAQGPKALLVPKPDDKSEGSDKVSAVSAYFTLGVNHATKPAPEMKPETRAAILEHFRKTQEADGAWRSYVAHPPMLDSGENSTLFVLNSMTGPNTPKIADAEERKARALKFLSTAPPTEELQTRLWRLALRNTLPESAPFMKVTQDEDVNAVLSQQNEDGGWGQNPELASDAYATGQALYFMTESGHAIPTAARERAVQFLLSTQKPDGSWAMKSRPRTLPKPDAGAKKLHIIAYAATSWATMGLISAAGEID